MPTRPRRLLMWTAGTLGLAVGAYVGHAGVAWLRYGRATAAGAADADPLLDRYMPAYDVVERHGIRVGAPADITFAAGCEQRLMSQPVVRAVVRAREILLGSEPDSTTRPEGLLELTRSLGWGMLAEIPGREIVMGAVTQPWAANVVFRPLPPDAFIAFDEPGHAKIAWTLRADPDGADAATFRTETRAVATDAEARRRFRRYWALVSPGIILIRWASLRPVKAEAERRARAAGPAPTPRPQGDRA